MIRCRLIGVLAVEQTNVNTGARERNDRLVAVPVDDATSEGIASIFEVPAQTRAALEQFFLHAVVFEGKALTLIGWSDAATARALVVRSGMEPPRVPEP